MNEGSLFSLFRLGKGFRTFCTGTDPLFKLSLSLEADFDGDLKPSLLFCPFASEFEFGLLFTYTVTSCTSMPEVVKSSG